MSIHDKKDAPELNHDVSYNLILVVYQLHNLTNLIVVRIITNNSKYYIYNIHNYY